MINKHNLENKTISCTWKHAHSLPVYNGNNEPNQENKNEVCFPIILTQKDGTKPM